MACELGKAELNGACTRSENIDPGRGCALSLEPLAATFEAERNRSTFDIRVKLGKAFGEIAVKADGPDFFDHVESWVRVEPCEAVKVAASGPQDTL